MRLLGRRFRLQFGQLFPSKLAQQFVNGIAVVFPIADERDLDERF